MKMFVLFALTALAPAVLAAQPSALPTPRTHTAAAAEQANVTIKVTGLTSNQPVHIAVWRKAAHFLSQPTFRHVTRTARNGAVTWVLQAVPYGGYAVAAWQDLNGNGKQDTNSVGAPVEPVGASRHATGFMGPPSFEDARVDIQKPNVTLSLTLKCPLGCEAD